MSTDSHAPLFRMEIAPRWRDLDAFNHVNNSNFLTYLEEARIQWFASIGREWLSDTMMPLLAAVQLNYRAPIPYPSKIAIALFADRVGNTSVTVGHRIESTDGATLYSDGHVVLVWIDPKNGRPIPFVARWRARDGVAGLKPLASEGRLITRQ